MLPYILNSIKQLEKAGADFIVLPCNTLHALLPELKKHSKIEFIDLIEETSGEIKKKYKKVAILGTTKTRNEKLYDKALKNIDIIYPSKKEQKELSKIIVRIIRKKHKKTDKIYLEKLINSLIKKGAEKVILACTDLANLIDNKNTIDTSEILIDSIKAKIF